jgi:hypothetical protein
MEEGFNVQRPPLLRGHNYSFWKNRMRAFLKAQGGGVWRIVEVGWTVPTKTDDATKETIKKQYEEFTIAEAKSADMNDKAMNAIFGAVDSSQYKLISNCTEAKQAWDILQGTHEGNIKVKIAKFQLLMSRFESLHMEENESITEFHGRVREIANQAARLEEPIAEKTLVLKVVRALPERFRTDVKAF